MSDGAYSRSASWITAISPSIHGIAARSALPLPPFGLCSTSVSGWPAAQRARIAGVASVEPSSTTITRLSSPSASSRRSTSSSVGASLYAGTRTVVRTAALTVGRAGETPMSALPEFSSPRGTLVRATTKSGLTLLLGASLALGALSLLAPSAPTTDPWGWIVWGREIAHLDLNTVAGPPSWKPLPVLFTTPLALLGGGAPPAWLAVARAGGILALAFAYRLGARLAGPAAGVIAAVALALSELWLRDLAHGYSEGLAVALALWAVESHLDGHRGRTVVLAGLVALSRPEAWPFAVAYTAAIVWAHRRRGPLLLGAVVVPPALWLGPDWWGSGDPFHAGVVARVNLLHAGPHPGLLVLRETWGILPAPVWLCAVAAVGLAALRREWT